MLPIHTILHPTDFSERSQFAFWLACSLARDYGARLIALHVVTVPTVVAGEGMVPPDPEELRAEGQQELDRLQPPRSDVRVRARLAEGDAVGEILRTAQENSVDLIVMGTHGRTGLARLLMGSVAEHVVRRALCPVLTVKAPFPDAVPVSDVRASVAAEPSVA